MNGTNISGYITKANDIGENAPVNGDNEARVSQGSREETSILNKVRLFFRNLTSNRSEVRKVEEVREARANDISLTTAIEAEVKAEGKLEEAKKQLLAQFNYHSLSSLDIPQKKKELKEKEKEAVEEAKEAKKEVETYEKCVKKATEEREVTEASIRIDEASLEKKELELEKTKEKLRKTSPFQLKQRRALNGEIEALNGEIEALQGQINRNTNEQLPELKRKEKEANTKLNEATQKLEEAKGKLEKVQKEVLEPKIAIAEYEVAKRELAFREQERAYSERLFELRQTESEIEKLKAHSTLKCNLFSSKKNREAEDAKPKHFLGLALIFCRQSARYAAV